jgi:hypothetical protein
MARDFTLDTQAAKESNQGGMRITESGAYAGRFTAAWYEQNDRGTESVHFLFRGDDGRECGPLALYTHNGSGEELPSYKTLNAVLTCMKLRGIKSESGKVNLYDYDSGGVVEKAKDVYPSLVNKPIGIVVQKEQYTKNSGDIGHRLLLIGAYEVATNRMASEVLSDSEPKALGNVIKWLGDNPVKIAKGSRASSLSSSSHADASNGTPYEDDIPFAAIARRAYW